MGKSSLNELQPVASPQGHKLSNTRAERTLEGRRDGNAGEGTRGGRSMEPLLGFQCYLLSISQTLPLGT